jgi:hypothetical protein
VLRGRLASGLLAGLLVLGAAVPSRSEVSLALSLDRTDSTLADGVMLTVSISGARGEGARPTIQGLEDFLVRPAGMTSRVEIVNGSYSTGTDFSYLLQPKKEGTFRIGPAELTVDGTTYRSAQATVTIGRPATVPDGDRGAIFLVASLAPAKLYLEQQAVYTLKLYRAVNIADVSLNVPQVDGLALTKLGEAREYQASQQGRQFQVVEVRYLLTPQKAGSYTLPPSRMDLVVFTPRSRKPRGIFDDPFFNQAAAGRPQSLVSESLALRVLPLPEQGRPADYGGLVGSFTLTATVEPQQLKAGESVTLTATVRGRGNAKRIPELKIPALDGVKIYADQPVMKDESDSDGVVVTKTMKWALVPERAGRYTIPPLALSYFDTATGGYRALKTAAVAVSVAPGVPGAAAAPVRPAAPSAGGQPKKAVAELGTDILPIHPTVGAAPAGLSALPGAAVFWLLLVGPPAAFALTLGGLVARRRSGSVVAALSVRSAAADFLKTSKRADLTADEALAALQEYLGRRLGIAAGSLTADDAAALLRARRADDQAVGALQALWRRIEDAIYTGQGRARTDAGAELARLVARIEKGLR